MRNLKRTMMGLLAGLSLAASPSAHAEKVGVCKVHITVNNQCASTTSVAYINFWHKDAKNKYTIPILELKNFKPDTSYHYDYDVLQPCSEPKKVEAKYQYPNPKKSSFQQTMGDWKWAEVESDWQSGKDVTINLSKCD